MMTASGVEWLSRRGPRTALAIVLSLLGALLPSAAHAEGWWAKTIRPAGFWSGPDATARLFGQLPRDTYVFVLDSTPEPGVTRFLAREQDEQNFGYVEAITLDPSPPPAGEAPLAPGLFRPMWVTALRDTSLTTASGETVSALPQFGKVLTLTPPDAGKYYVQDARTGRVGYLDGTMVGPGAAPTPEDEVTWASPAFALINEAYRPWWAATLQPTELWSSDTGGVVVRNAPAGEQLLVLEGQKGARLSIFNPTTQSYAFVDAVAVGPSAGRRPPGIEVGGWVGTVSRERANLRFTPQTAMTAAGQLLKGDEITVSAWVEGEELEQDNRTWARILSVRRQASNGNWVDFPFGDSAPERYIFSGLVRAVPLADYPPAPDLSLGAEGAKWVDVNVTHQVFVGYEGSKPVYMAPVTTGRPGWPTVLGVYRIVRRVENETMLGSTIRRADTGESPDYKLENVRWTQYFTGNGYALHTNYWRSPVLFGIPSSHGCVGMLEKHANWLWTWAGINTPVNIHV